MDDSTSTATPRAVRFDERWYVDAGEGFLPLPTGEAPPVGTRILDAPRATDIAEILNDMFDAPAATPPADSRAGRLLAQLAQAIDVSAKRGAALLADTLADKSIDKAGTVALTNLVIGAFDALRASITAPDAPTRARAAYTIDPANHTQEPAGENIRAFMASLTSCRELLADLGAMASMVDFLLAERPRGLDDVTTQLFVALSDFERKSAGVHDAAIAWGEFALKGPQIKADCLASLMTPEGGGLSRSAAEKAVTAHPTYAAYREQLDGLASAKLEAERVAGDGKLRVETLREISAAFRVQKLEVIGGGSKMRDINTALDRAAGLVEAAQREQLDAEIQRRTATANRGGMPA